jgi:hypothetical protein
MDPGSPESPIWPLATGGRSGISPIQPFPSGSGAPSLPQTVGASFVTTSLSESGFVPPDTCGSVGPTQVLVCSNGRIKVFNKTGTLGGLNVGTDSFFQSVRGGSGTSDPQVKYDRLSGRWFVTMCNVSTPNRLLIAVSSGSTITNASSFTFYQFQQDLVSPTGNTGQFADYPKTGVDANAVVIGCNMFAGGFAGTSAWVIRKTSILSGGPIVVTALRGLATGGGAGPFRVPPEGEARATVATSSVSTTRFRSVVLRCPQSRRQADGLQEPERHRSPDNEPDGAPAVIVNSTLDDACLHTRSQEPHHGCPVAPRTTSR